MENLERKIHKIYSEASIKVVENLKKFLKDFDRKDKANKKKMTEDEYREWRKRQAATLNTMLKRQDHITQSLVEADRLAAEVINRNASLVYSEGFNYGTYQIESVGEVDTAFVLYDADTIERLIKDDPNLLPVNPNIPKIEQWNHSHITTAITQGIIQGESIPKIAKRLQIVVGMDERSSMRNARTATIGAENAGRMASYRRAQELGINVEKKWLATYDSRTRHSHAMIDGERVKVDGKFSNRCRYPGDPEGPPSEIWNCRCTLIPVVNDKDDDSWKNDIAIGNDEKSYAEWKAEHMARVKTRPESVTDTVIQGKNLVGEWHRRKDMFDFEIEDVINAQGFDGKPRVVSPEEFDELVRQANDGEGFIAQRTYSAPTQEVLDEYRNQLYNGKWYVDCSTGGAQYGQGMYCAADYEGVLSKGIKSEMEHYISNSDMRLMDEAWRDEEARLKKQYAKRIQVDRYFLNDKKREFMSAYQAPHYVETLTLDKSARILTLPKGEDAYEYIVNRYENEALRKYGIANGKASVTRTVSSIQNEKVKNYNDYLNSKITSEELYARADELNAELNEIYRDNPDVKEAVTKIQNQSSRMDPGTMATLMGYDAINAVGHGASGSYTVILNRTKVIFRRNG